MNLIGDLFKGMIVLSFIAVVQDGCSVKNMANRAAQAHKNTVSYGAFSRKLTDFSGSWAKHD